MFDVVVGKTLLIDNFGKASFRFGLLEGVSFDVQPMSRIIAANGSVMRVVKIESQLYRFVNVPSHYFGRALGLHQSCEF